MWEQSQAMIMNDTTSPKIGWTWLCYSAALSVPVWKLLFCSSHLSVIDNVSAVYLSPSYILSDLSISCQVFPLPKASCSGNSVQDVSSCGRKEYIYRVQTATVRLECLTSHNHREVHSFVRKSKTRFRKRRGMCSKISKTTNWSARCARSDEVARGVSTVQSFWWKSSWDFLCKFHQMPIHSCYFTQVYARFIIRLVRLIIRLELNK